VFGVRAVSHLGGAVQSGTVRRSPGPHRPNARGSLELSWAACSASVPSRTWVAPCSLELYGVRPALTCHRPAAVLNCRGRRVRCPRCLAPGRRRAVWNRATLSWPLVKHLPRSGTVVGGVFGAMPSCTWAGSCGLEPCNACLVLKWRHTCGGLEPWWVA
jgi:hypothetical protein